MQYVIFLPDAQEPSAEHPWIGRGVKLILTDSDFSDWIEKFRRHPELGSRFYVERMVGDEDNNEQQATTARHL